MLYAAYMYELQCAHRNTHSYSVYNSLSLSRSLSLPLLPVRRGFLTFVAAVAARPQHTNRTRGPPRPDMKLHCGDGETRERGDRWSGACADASAGVAHFARLNWKLERERERESYVRRCCEISIFAERRPQIDVAGALVYYKGTRRRARVSLMSDGYKIAVSVSRRGKCLWGSARIDFNIFRKCHFSWWI